jgi:hypothetical protein
VANCGETVGNCPFLPANVLCSEHHWNITTNCRITADIGFTNYILHSTLNITMNSFKYMISPKLIIDLQRVSKLSHTDIPITTQLISSPDFGTSLDFLISSFDLHVSANKHLPLRKRLSKLISSNEPLTSLIQSY